MTKKVLCVLLAVVMIFGSLAVTSFATVDYKDLIDRTFLSGRLKSDITTVPDVADSEAILEENLLYWDEEVQTAYKAAKTNEDYEALYELMSTPVTLGGETFDDMWYAHRDESYGKVSIRYVADKYNAQVGDRFTVNAYLTTNFYTPYAALGIVFNKNLVELETISQNVSTFSGWTLISKNTNYGFLSSGTDARATLWPKSMRNAADYAEYGMAQVYLAANTSKGNYAKKFNDDLVFSATFIVKDGATDGAPMLFTAPSDCDWASEDIFDYYENSSSLFGFERVTENAYPYKSVDEMVFCDHTYSVKNGSVSVGDIAYADYSEYNKAVALYSKLYNHAGEYTVDSWNVFKSAATAELDMNLTLSDQKTVNDATDAILTAYNGLRVKGVRQAKVIGAPKINTNANIKIVVAGSPSIVRLVDADDRANTITLFREDISITKTDGIETWSTAIYAAKTKSTYIAYARYSDGYSMNSATLVINASEFDDLTVHSMTICDMVSRDGHSKATNNGLIAIGRHQIIFTTSTAVYKIQFIDENGNTWTYSAADKSLFTDNDGERTWTVPLNFPKYGDWTLGVRTRAVNSTFVSDVGEDLVAYVL